MKAAGKGQATSQSKLYVPLQCHKPSESAMTSAWASNPTNFPVPPENFAVPFWAARSSTTWPFAVFPDPASRTTSVSRVPSPAASAYITLAPASISSRFEDVIVQKSPARPLYSEHSLVT
jgi:hypothetical protein